MTLRWAATERQRGAPCMCTHACDKNWCQPAAGWRRAGSAGQSHARQGTRLPLLTNCVYAYRNTEPGLPTRVPRWKSLHYDKLATAPIECRCTCSRVPTAQPGTSVRAIRAVCVWQLEVMHRSLSTQLCSVHPCSSVCPLACMTLAGLEPAIFGSEDQRLIH